MRIRVTITGTYEIDPDRLERDYETTDILKACAIDQKNFEDYSPDVLDILDPGTIAITVSPDGLNPEERQTLPGSDFEDPYSYKNYDRSTSRAGSAQTMCSWNTTRRQPTTSLSDEDLRLRAPSASHALGRRPHLEAHHRAGISPVLHGGPDRRQVQRVDLRPRDRTRTRHLG